MPGSRRGYGEHDHGPPGKPVPPPSPPAPTWPVRQGAGRGRSGAARRDASSPQHRLRRGESSPNFAPESGVERSRQRPLPRPAPAPPHPRRLLPPLPRRSSGCAGPCRLLRQGRAGGGARRAGPGGAGGTRGSCCT